MIARMLLVWLLLVNLGVAAWWWLHPAPRAIASVPTQAALPKLALIDAAAGAASTNLPTAMRDAASPASVADAASSSTSQPQLQPSAAMTSVCASFGPYADDAAMQSARQALAALGASVQLRRSAGRSARGYDVYLPPLADREAAAAMAERLRAAGFGDLAVIRQGERANGIALGRFGGEENARRHQAALQAKGFVVQVAPVGGEAANAQLWLDVRAPAGFDANAQRARLAAPQAKQRGC